MHALVITKNKFLPSDSETPSLNWSTCSAMQKQLVNSADAVVVEALEGFLLANPQLARLDGLPDVKVSRSRCAIQLVLLLVTH